MKDKKKCHNKVYSFARKTSNMIAKHENSIDYIRYNCVDTHGITATASIFNLFQHYISNQTSVYNKQFQFEFPVIQRVVIRDVSAVKV